MTEPLADPDDDNAQLMTRQIQMAPRYVAGTTALVILWIYVIVGEFVLAGVPEWLGWGTVLSIATVYYWTQERRLFAYMTSNSWRQRLLTIGVIVLMILIALLLAIVLGAVLPEPVVTMLILMLIGLAARWKRAVRLRLYANLWQNEGWRRLGKTTFVGAFTILAFGALIARQ